MDNKFTDNYDNNKIKVIGAVGYTILDNNKIKLMVIADMHDITEKCGDIFISDWIKQQKNFKLLLDVKINLGVLSDDAIKKFADKLVINKTIDNISDLFNKRIDYENIKKSFFNYVEKNRIYTLEDSYDSAPISHTTIMNFINSNDVKNNINLFCYISNLIFSSDDLPDKINKYKDERKLGNS